VSLLIIFPFGFYILDGRMPVRLGNDLAAQTAMRAWMHAHPEQIRLGCDDIGAIKVETVFLGWDRVASPARMDQTPLLFETTIAHGQGEPQMQRRTSDYDDALTGHAALVALARCGLLTTKQV
jgi:hypothetical protein